MYKLREERLRNFYIDEMDSSIGLSKTPLTRSHGESLTDQSYQSFKTKEIRDSESPTRDYKYGMSVPDKSGWNIVTKSELSTDGKTQTNASLATTSAIQDVKGGKQSFCGKNEEIATHHYDGDEKNFTASTGHSSNTLLKEEVITGDERGNKFESRTNVSSNTSSSSKVTVSNQQTEDSDHKAILQDFDKMLNESLTTQNSTTESSKSKTSIQNERMQREFSKNQLTNRNDVGKPMANQSSATDNSTTRTVEYPDDKTKVIIETKHLPDGSTVTTKKYETRSTSSKVSSRQESSQSSSSSSQTIIKDQIDDTQQDRNSINMNTYKKGQNYPIDNLLSESTINDDIRRHTELRVNDLVDISTRVDRSDVQKSSSNRRNERFIEKEREHSRQEALKVLKDSQQHRENNEQYSTQQDSVKRNVKQDQHEITDERKTVKKDLSHQIDSQTKAKDKIANDSKTTDSRKINESDRIERESSTTKEDTKVSTIESSDKQTTTTTTKSVSKTISDYTSKKISVDNNPTHEAFARSLRCVSPVDRSRSSQTRSTTTSSSQHKLHKTIDPRNNRIERSPSRDTDISDISNLSSATIIKSGPREREIVSSPERKPAGVKYIPTDTTKTSSPERKSVPRTNQASPERKPLNQPTERWTELNRNSTTQRSERTERIEEKYENSKIDRKSTDDNSSQRIIPKSNGNQLYRSPERSTSKSTLKPSNKSPERRPSDLSKKPYEQNRKVDQSDDDNDTVKKTHQKIIDVTKEIHSIDSTAVSSQHKINTETKSNKAPLNKKPDDKQNVPFETKRTRSDISPISQTRRNSDQHNTSPERKFDGNKRKPSKDYDQHSQTDSGTSEKPSYARPTESFVRHSINNQNTVILNKAIDTETIDLEEREYFNRSMSRSPDRSEYQDQIHTFTELRDFERVEKPNEQMKIPTKPHADDKLPSSPTRPTSLSPDRVKRNVSQQVRSEKLINRDSSDKILCGTDKLNESERVRRITDQASKPEKKLNEPLKTEDHVDLTDQSSVPSYARPTKSSVRHSSITDQNPIKLDLTSIDRSDKYDRQNIIADSEDDEPISPVTTGSDFEFVKIQKDSETVDSTQKFERIQNEPIEPFYLDESKMPETNSENITKRVPFKRSETYEERCRLMLGMAPESPVPEKKLNRPKLSKDIAKDTIDFLQTERKENKSIEKEYNTKSIKVVDKQLTDFLDTEKNHQRPVETSSLDVKITKLPKQTHDDLDTEPIDQPEIEPEIITKKVINNIDLEYGQGAIPITEEPILKKNSYVCGTEENKNDKVPLKPSSRSPLNRKYEDDEKPEDLPKKINKPVGSSKNVPTEQTFTKNTDKTSKITSKVQEIKSKINQKDESTPSVHSILKSRQIRDENIETLHDVIKNTDKKPESNDTTSKYINSVKTPITTPASSAKDKKDTPKKSDPIKEKRPNELVKNTIKKPIVYDASDDESETDTKSTPTTPSKGKKHPLTERNDSFTKSLKPDQKDAHPSKPNTLKESKPISKSTVKPQTKTETKQRPIKCVATKTINLTPPTPPAVAANTINSADIEDVIIDIQQAKSSREPTPNRIIPIPALPGEDTGKPRYPDVIQEPDDEQSKRKPKIQNIPIFEEETKQFIQCEITEVTDDSSVTTDRQDELYENHITDKSTVIDSSKEKLDECLLSVQDKVSKFLITAEETKKPKPSQSFKRPNRIDNLQTISSSTHEDLKEDHCLMSVTDKVLKFSQPQQELQSPKERKVFRTPSEEVNDDLIADDCLLCVSDKVTKFITTAEKLVASTPQKSPELVAKIERQVSKTSNSRPNRISLSDINTVDMPKEDTMKSCATTPQTDEPVQAEPKRHPTTPSKPIKEYPDESTTSIPSKSTKKESITDRYKPKSEKPISISSPQVTLRSTEIVKNAKAIFERENLSPTSKQKDILSRPSVWEERRKNEEQGDVKLRDIGIFKRTDDSPNDENIAEKPLEDIEISIRKTSTSTYNHSKEKPSKTKPQEEPQTPKSTKIHEPSKRPSETPIKLASQPATKTTPKFHEKLVEQISNDTSSSMDTVREQSPIGDEPSTADRPSYMNHTVCSIEHSRRDSIEYNKTSSKRSSLNTTEDIPHIPHSPTDTSGRNSITKFGVELKRTNSQQSQGQRRKSSSADIPHIEEIFDLELLEKMLETVVGYEQRRRIRSQIRVVKRQELQQKTQAINVQKNVKATTPLKKDGSTLKSTDIKSKQTTDSGSLRTQRTDSSHLSKVDTVRKSVKSITTEKPTLNGNRNVSPDKVKTPTKNTTITNRSPSPSWKKTPSRISEKSVKPQSDQTKTQVKTQTNNSSINETEYNSEYSKTSKLKNQTSIDSKKRFTSPENKKTNGQTTIRSSSPVPLKSHETTSNANETEYMSQYCRNETNRNSFKTTKTSSNTTNRTARSPSPKQSTVPIQSSTPKVIESKSRPIKLDTKVDTKEPEKPIWATTNILKKASETVTTRSFKTATPKKTPQKVTKPIPRDTVDDCIISSYGIGPTDEDGNPLFGIRALKKKSQPNQTTKVTGSIFTESLHSENGSMPVGTASITHYSTDPDDVKPSVVDTTNPDADIRTHDNGITSVTRVRKIGNDVEHPEKFAIDFGGHDRKVVRRGSVKELTEKLIQKESQSQATNEKKTSASSYPKAGLILRSKEQYSRESTPVATPSIRSDSVEFDESDIELRQHSNQQMETFDDDDCDQTELSTVASSHYTTSSTLSSSSRRYESNEKTKSFLNSDTKVTGVQDILNRMRNADNVQEAGDTDEDKEARALLNKFLGATVLMSGMESMVPKNVKIASNSSSDRPSSTTTKTQSFTATRQQTKSTTKGSTPSNTTQHKHNRLTTCDINDIWDEKLLKQLLEQSTEYEERRKIRARLRQIMAEKEESSETKEIVDSTTTVTSTSQKVSSQTVTSTSKTVTEKSTAPFAKFRQLDKQGSTQSNPKISK